ncbi:MAG: VOC family protein [Anaerolineae bacterium]|nr:VOC family protein [Anaerolineae bacterium]
MLSAILACTDVSMAIGYYVDKLGFELAWQMPPDDDGKTTFAGVKLGDSEIMLGVVEGYVEPDDLRKRGLGVQLYIRLPKTISIDDVYARAEAAGATITRALEARDWGERSFNVRDADGYNLMIAAETS